MCNVFLIAFLVFSMWSAYQGIMVECGGERGGREREGGRVLSVRFVGYKQISCRYMYITTLSECLCGGMSYMYVSCVGDCMYIHYNSVCFSYL